MTRSRRGLPGGLICAVVVVVATCLPGAATAAEVEHPFLENFGAASGSEPSFTEAQGLAVDQTTGDLLVIDRAAKTLSRYKPNGEPDPFSALSTNVIGGFSFDEFSAKPDGFEQVAVDNSGGVTDGDIYVTEPDENALSIVGSDGSLLGHLRESSEGPLFRPCGVAVDSASNVYVGEFTNHIHKYEPIANGANFAFEKGCNLAAGSGPTGGFLFATHLNNPTVANKSVVKLDATNGEEKYEVDPGPATTVAVDPATGFLFVARGNELREYDASGASEAKVGTPIAAGGEKITGVAVDQTTGRIYVAREGNPHIEVWGPAGQLPEATTEAASAINGTVIFHGAVGANGGTPATCVFQYINVEAEDFNGASSVPCSPAGPFSGTATNSVEAEVTNLPEATYRFRLLATNEKGFSKAGEALLFETFETVPGLPDGRAYELVSPAQKVGEVVPPEPTTQLGGTCAFCLPGENTPSMPMQSTADGETVLYGGQPFSAGLAAQPSNYVAARTRTGWGTVGLSSATTTGEYLAFSPDLSRGVLAQESPPLSPLAPIRGAKAFPNLYLQEGGARQPLVTEEPPNREPGDFRIRYATANEGTATVPGFEHLIFEANDTLTGAVTGIAPAAPEVAASGRCTTPGARCNLYEWEGGWLRLVNVLPENEEAAAEAVIGAGSLLKAGQSPDVSHAISADGSRVFWSDGEDGHLYVRIGGEETLEVPGPGSCKESVAVEARACFLTASIDGSEVLLSDGQVFALNEAGDAYEPTVDLTDGKEGFRGILGASEDLSRLYFIDTKVLTDESEENANGEHAEEGEDNLYAWNDGALAFIGILLPGDNGFGVGLGSASRFGAWTASPSHRTAQVSADGRSLTFMSLAPLTGYDNRLRGGGDCRSSQTPACREVFEYGAESKTLVCASCNPTGQRPLGDSNLSLIAPTGGEGVPFPQLANLSPAGGGRLFFESQDVLSPRDTNGQIQDVYEWEPGGVGSCKRAAGCVYLISSGTSANDSMFLDSSASGDDAFFITRQQLLPPDRNQQLDLYDARVGGGITEAISSSCSGEGCPGPIPDPPSQPSPGSTGVSGPGNARPKHKKHHKKKRHHKRSTKQRRAAGK